jgi:hypothetical protein
MGYWLAELLARPSHAPSQYPIPVPDTIGYPGQIHRSTSPHVKDQEWDSNLCPGHSIEPLALAPPSTRLFVATFRAARRASKMVLSTRLSGVLASGGGAISLSCGKMFCHTEYTEINTLVVLVDLYVFWLLLGKLARSSQLSELWRTRGVDTTASTPEASENPYPNNPC